MMIKIKVKVKTNQPRFLAKEGILWEVSLKSKPEKNQANQELVRELSKIYGHARILSGFKSKIKMLEIGTKA
jgi:uncharacterized protein YggU (UPF0235/DUF167 family)